MRRVILLAFLAFVFVGCNDVARQAIVQPVGVVDTASVTDIRFPSASITGLLWYRAIAPEIGPNERLPVLYLLHGVNSGPIEIMQRSHVVKLAVAARMIVVIPEAGFSYYTNAKHKKDSRWEDAIATELPRDVRARFPVLQDPEHTGIAGISMGGYGAVKLALKHPELYRFVGNMSGALDITERRPSLRRWGQTMRIWSIFGIGQSARKSEDVFYLLDHRQADKHMNWFESCGQDDPLYGVNARFARQLREREMKLTAITTKGGHDWQSWNDAMPELFRAATASLR